MADSRQGPLRRVLCADWKKGIPAKAYLYEEAEALVVALNTHYGEHFTFRDTDTGLRRNVHTSLTLIRDKKSKEIGYARSR